MKPVSVEQYIELRVKYEPYINVKELESDIRSAIRLKLEGYACRECQGELWAVGVVISDDYLCYDCIGLEPNSENDIEFDILLEKVY